MIAIVLEIASKEDIEELKLQMQEIKELILKRNSNDNIRYLTPKEFANIRRCKLTKVYEQLARKEIKSIKNGRDKLIPYSEIEREV